MLSYVIALLVFLSRHLALKSPILSIMLQTYVQLLRNHL
jgi:hypothetical protein